MPDGSLSGGENSGEIVSPVLGYDDIEELQNIIRAVRAAGARTDHSTGIHIHVGAERFDAKSVVNLVKLVHKQERLLEHALGVSEQRLARYLGNHTRNEAGATIVASTLHAAYSRWVHGQNAAPVSLTTFGNLIAKQGISKEKVDGLMHYQNLRFIADDNSEARA